MMEYKLLLLVGCLAGIVLVSSGSKIYGLEAKDNNLFAEEDNSLAKGDSGITSQLELKVEEKLITSSCYYSSEVELYNILWTIKLCESHDALKISLIYLFGDDVAKLSSQATGNIKILHKDNTKADNIERGFKNVRIFKKNTQEIDLESVKWTDFTQNYVKDGVARFKLSLTVERPVPLQTLEHVSTKFSLQVFDVTDVQGTKSPNLVLRGVKWHVWAVPYEHNSVPMFSVFVGGDVTDMDINSIYEVTATITLKANKGGKDKDKTSTFTNKYNWRDPIFGAIDFIKMDELQKSDFIYDNNVLLQIELTVKAPTSL